MSISYSSSENNWEIPTSSRTSALVKESLEPVSRAAPAMTDSDQGFLPFFGENPNLPAEGDFSHRNNSPSPTALNFTVATTKRRLLASLAEEIPPNMISIINPDKDPVILGKGGCCAVILEQQTGRCFKFLRESVLAANPNAPSTLHQRLAREYYFLSEVLQGIKGLPRVYEAYSEQTKDDLLIATHYPSPTGNKPDRLTAFRIEYLKGYKDLEDLYPDLSGSTKVSIIIATLKILAEIHARQVLHRDLSTRNIMVKIEEKQMPSQLETAIIDFGFVHHLDPERMTSLTLPNRFVGQPVYAPPEQCQNHKSEYSTALDLYAVGIILFKIFADEFPFYANDPQSILRKQVLVPAPSLLNFFRRKNHPGAIKLSAIVAKCLRKDYRERYQSATELRVELENLLENWSEFE